MMFVKMFTVGMLATNCFLVGDQETGDAVVIDPGIDHESEAEPIFSEVEHNGFRIKYIVNTHGHPDHSGGNRLFKERSRALVLIYEDDASLLSSSPADRMLRDDDIIAVGNMKLRVVHTPGHSPGSMALLAEDCIFSGDTLFAGSIGRYDLPGGSAEKLVDSLRRKLLTLPDYIKVFPGHGPVTTIGEERRSNPFLKSFDWMVFG